MRRSKVAVLLGAASLFAIAVAVSYHGMPGEAFAGSDGHGTNVPDRGAVKSATEPAILQVDPAVLATGERVKDLSLMSNQVPEG